MCLILDRGGAVLRNGRKKQEKRDMSVIPNLVTLLRHLYSTIAVRMMTASSMFVMHCAHCDWLIVYLLVGRITIRKCLRVRRLCPAPGSSPCATRFHIFCITTTTTTTTTTTVIAYSSWSILLLLLLPPLLQSIAAVLKCTRLLLLLLLLLLLIPLLLPLLLWIRVHFSTITTTATTTTHHHHHYSIDNGNDVCTCRWQAGWWTHPIAIGSWWSAARMRRGRCGSCSTPSTSQPTWAAAAAHTPAPST